MRRFFLPLVAASALLLLSCGGDSPSSPTAAATTAPPTTPTRITLTVVSGETEAPVAGALVVVAGTAYQTDSHGRVVLDAPQQDAFVDIQAQGFLDRLTLLRRVEDTSLTLWPRTSPNGLNEELTRRIVYTWVSEDSPPGGKPLARVALGADVHVVPSQEIRENVKAMRVIDEAVGVMNEALDGKVTYRVVDSLPRAGVVVELSIDPDAASSEYIATWQVFWNNWEIYRTELKYRSVSIVYDDGRLITHHLGHAFGLTDSPDSTDRMYRDWCRRRRNDFSDKEVLAMHLMLQRYPGNRFPDNDREVSGRGSRGTMLGYTPAPGPKVSDHE